jgi:GTP cyclohydrolase I
MEFNQHVISARTMPKLLDLLRTKLKSNDAYARFEFDYYLDRKAPVSKKEAPQRYRCAFTGIKRNGDYSFIIEVNVVAASLCPCSREMSLLTNLTHGKEITYSKDYQCPDVAKKVGMGAHNQRSHIRVELISEEGDIIWLEDLIGVIEKQASAPVYPILKRADEKFVTEQAYNNAKFSEDITRDVQIAIESLPHVKAWALRVYNEESIHPYDVACYQCSPSWKY